MKTFIDEKVEKLIKEINQLKVVTYDEVLKEDEEQPLLDCIEVDTGVFAYNAGQDLFILQDLFTNVIENCNTSQLKLFLQYILEQQEGQPLSQKNIKSIEVNNETPFERFKRKIKKINEIIADIDKMQQVTLEQLEDINNEEPFENYHLYAYAFIYKSIYNNKYYLEHIGSNVIDTINKRKLVFILLNNLGNG